MADVAEGLKRVAGNRNLYRNLLLKFRQSQPRAIEDIRGALAARDDVRELDPARAHVKIPVLEAALRRVASSIAGFAETESEARASANLQTV